MSARRALAKVGEYFSSTGPNAPILSAANGGECQQNYNLLMSDGFWNGRDAGVGNADIDGGAGNTVFDGNVAQANDQGNYADDFSETLADVSMTYYENDLRPLLNDRVPIQATIDEAEHQHLVTYTIAFGLSGKLDPAVDNPLAAGFSWPEPIANDGMLHGFDDDTGAEVIAYVPNLLSSSNIGDGLHYLTESNYVHKFYVDLTPTLSDVYLSTGGATAWHTILVGGLRGGGRGFYALDVTNPGLFSEANADKLVMWEFSSSDDIDLGYTYSRPVIAYTNAGTWVAIFGNGYNDLGSGEASLFIVDIEKGVDGDWQSGDYIKLSTGVGTAASRNGLASPALADIDGNGTVDRVYAGDLEGNLWAFDMENPNSS
jgi:hypothetical protein